MQLTERDIEILHFINDMGFCEMPQINKKFNMKRPMNYRVISRLIDAKLIQHVRVLYGRHGVYYLTGKGASYTNLPAIDKISLGNYDHQIILTNVHLKLSELYPYALYISERQLKHEKFNTGIGKKGHVADGILLFPDGKQIAIEVELTIKSKERIQKIFKGYGMQLAIKEVWYFCKENIRGSLSQQAAKLPYIKVQSLNEILQ